MSATKTLVTCIALLVAGAVVTALIFSTEPAAKRTGAVKETAMLVDLVEVHRGSHRPSIVATGVVEPSQDVILSPRVGGEIVERAPAFVPGGHVREGEMLLRIDPADYRNVLAQRRSELSQAEADLQMEMGRQTVAEQDYERLDATLSDRQRALVLREPQLSAARARVEAAHAAVEQAELDLERTTIKAPFDAHILERTANVGSQVAPGESLGHLVGMEAYWISLTLPLARLRWLDIPADGEEGGSSVTIRNRTAWEPDEHRDGRLYRLVGALQEDTRMARVLVTVPDPLGYDTDTTDVPALMIGAFVEATIEGRELEDVVRVSRDHIRDDDIVWLMEDGKLVTREVDIVMQDATHAYVRSGLEDGDRVVVTNLSTVTDGAPLRTR
jgi:RND family efflux transporter MFP subunit